MCRDESSALAWSRGRARADRKRSCRIARPEENKLAVIVASQGRLLGSGTVKGNVVARNGAVIPGASPGTLTIDGDFELGDAGVLELEVGGLLPGQQHDQLVVTQDALMTGTIVITFVNGFIPRAGDQIKLFDVDGSLTATQARYVLPDGFAIESIGEGGFRFEILPTLTYSTPGPATFRLAWTSDAIDYRLQTSATLDNDDWSFLTPPITASGHHDVNMSAAPRAYFRLFKQN